jgi:hypothetical protein
LLKDKDKANFFGKNAQDFIREHFPQQKMVRETEEAYEECLKAKR